MYFQQEIIQGLLRSINKALCCGCSTKRNSQGVREVSLKVDKSFCCEGFAPPSLIVEESCCSDGYFILTLPYLCCSNGLEGGVALTIEDDCCSENLVNLVVPKSECCNKVDLVVQGKCCVEESVPELFVDNSCCENTFDVIELILGTKCCVN